MHREDMLRRVADSLDDPLRQDILRHIAGEIGDGYKYHQTERSGSYIRDTLADHFESWDNGVYRVPLDGTYYCAWQPDVEHFMTHEWGDKFDHIKTEYDCENYAVRFKALADRHGFNNVGIVIDWSTAHAYNVAVYPGRHSPQLIEPQNSSFVEIAESDLYELGRGVVLI